MQDVMEIPQAHAPSPAKVFPPAADQVDVQHNADQDTCNDGIAHVSIGSHSDAPVGSTAAAALDPSKVQQAEASTAAVPQKVCSEWVEAAKSGDAGELRRLLRAHPSLLNQQVGGLQCTATHWAAANGHSDTLQHLLEWGADITVQTATGCLPIHSAAAAGRVECAQQLLAIAPALQQQQLTALNEDGLTAAALALRHGHKLLQGFLVQAAASSQDPQGAEAAQGVDIAQHAAAGSTVSADAQLAHHQQQQEQQRPVKQQPGMRRGFLNSGQNSSTTHAQHPKGTCGDSGVSNDSSANDITTAAAAAGDAQHWDSTVNNPLFGVSSSPAKHPHQQEHLTAVRGSSRMSPEAALLMHDPLNSSVQPAGLEGTVSSQEAAAAPPGSSHELPSDTVPEDPVHTEPEGHAVQQQAAVVPSTTPASAAAAAAAGTSATPAEAGAAAPTAATAAKTSVTPPAAAAAAAAATTPAAAVDRTVGRSWLDAARSGDLAHMQALLQQNPQLLDYRGAGISYAFVGNSALHWASAKGHKACVVWLLQQGASVGVVNEAGSTALHTAVEHQQPGCAGVLVLQGGADVQAEDGYGQRVTSLAGPKGAPGSSSRGCGVLIEQLLLWDQALKLQQQDRSAWSNGTMQRLLQLAGKSAEAAKCLEKHELVELAAAELQRVMGSV